MMRPIFLALAVLSLLAGCTAHYRQSLKAFERGRTPSFLQRTLDWTAQSGANTNQNIASLSNRPPIAEAARDDLETSYALIAEVVNTTFAETKRRIDNLDEPSELDAVFARRVDIDNLFIAVALHNPEVRAAHADWQATLRQYEQADFLDGLLGQFRAYTRYLNIETGAPRNREMSRAWFPYPGVVAYRGEMIRQMARMAQLDWQRLLRDNLVVAGEKFAEYQYLTRAEPAAEENVRTVGDLVGVMEERYRTGLVNQPDVLKIQNQHAVQRTTLLDVQSRRRTIKAQLNALIGRVADAPLGAPVLEDLPVPEIPAKDLARIAADHRQEILIQQAAIARTQASIRMSEVMNRPPASAGAGTFERGMMPESPAGSISSPSDSAMASAEPSENALTFGEQPRPAVPPLNFAQAEAYLSETRVRLQADQYRLNGIQLQTESLAREAVENLDIARRNLELFERTTFPQARRAHELALTDYTSGNTTFLDLLDTQRELINTRLMVHAAHRDLNIAVLRLAIVAGGLMGNVAGPANP